MMKAGPILMIGFLMIGFNGIMASTLTAEAPLAAKPISPKNLPPTSFSQSLITAEDIPIKIRLEGKDPENSPLSYTIDVFPSNGILMGSPPDLRYTPRENFHGLDQFQFKTHDGTQDSENASVNIKILPLNDPPSCRNIMITINEDLTATQDLHFLCHDADREEIQFRIVEMPVSGEARMEKAKISYSPHSEFHGSDLMRIQAKDPSGATSQIATLYFTIKSVNDPPTPAIETLTTYEDNPLSIILFAHDVDEDSLTYDVVLTPSHGQLNFHPPPTAFFKSSRAFDVRTAPTALELDDFNKDGKTDLVIVNEDDHTISVLMGTGTGSFSDEITYVVEQGSRSVATGDLNLDGNPDIAVANEDSHTISVFLGSPTGTFNQFSSIPIKAFPRSVIIGKIDQDDIPDLGVVTPGEESNPKSLDTITILHGIGTGAFKNPTRLKVNKGPNFINAGDFNQDGRFDLVVTNKWNNTISVLLGNENGSFETLQDYSVGSFPISVAIGDLNHDKIADFAVANFLSNDVSILLGNGSGQFKNSAEYGVEKGPTAVAIGDLNGDTNPDLALSSEKSGSISILMGTGSGSFDPSPSINVGSKLSHVTLHDLNSDGKLDLISLDKSKNKVWVFLNTTPDIIYQPVPDFNGSDQIQYRANDGLSESGIGTLSIKILPINDKPVAKNKTLMTPEDTSVSFTLEATDIETDPMRLQFQILTLPKHGLLMGSPPKMTYTPSSDYHGHDSFTFTALDTGDGASPPLRSSERTISITVTPINDPPVCEDLNVLVAEDQSTFRDLDLFCADPDGDPLSYEVITPSPHGEAQVKDSKMTFTPLPDFYGKTLLSFQASDPQGAASLPVTITFDVTPLNDPPTGIDQSITTLEDTPLKLSLTGHDLETGANQLRYEIINHPENGQLIGTTPELQYFPRLNFFGSDRFTFIVHDESAVSKTATISINIFPVNDPPHCKEFHMAVNEDQSASKDLESVCTDVDGDPLSYETVRPSPNGRVRFEESSLFFIPQLDFHGMTTIAFRARDPHGLVSRTTLSRLLVSSVNDPPIALNQTLKGPEDNPLTLTLTATDIETDPGRLHYHIVDSPAHGTVRGSPPAVIYHPHPDYNGTDSFTFTVTDIGESKRASLTSKKATIFIQVSPVNDSPVIAPIKGLSIEEGKLLQFSVEVKDVDLDPVRLNAHGLPSNAVFDPQTGALQYTPDFDVSHKEKERSFEISFQAEDGQGGSDTRSARLIVKDINQAPVVIDQSIRMNEDSSIRILPSGEDLDGDPLQFIIMKGPQYGDLKEDGDRITYQPKKNFYGKDTFLFQASDGLLTSNSARMQIEIQPVNDPPNCSNTTIELGLNQSISYDLMPYCFDIDGDPIKILIEPQAGNGTFDLLGSVLTYIPFEDFLGSDSLIFKAVDPTGSPSNTATLTIIIRSVDSTH